MSLRKQPVPPPGLPMEGEHAWKIDYDKHEDRLRLFLPQLPVRHKGRDIAGDNAHAVYIEIPRPDPHEKKPFFHIALSPRKRLNVLRDRLELYHLTTGKWPITFTPESWHEKEAWNTGGAWEGKMTREPALIVPIGNAFESATSQYGNPAFGILKEKGFVTPETVKAIETALQEFIASKPGKFKKMNLEQHLEEIYPDALKEDYLTR